MIKVNQIINCLFPRKQEGDDSNDDQGIDIIEDNQLKTKICKVSLDELRGVINDLPSAEKAPGPDGITGFLWMKALPITGPAIVDIFTKCLSLGIFPDRWKLARLVLISKPDKPIGDPSAYRPLCMLDEIGKLLERIIVGTFTYKIKSESPVCILCKEGIDDVIHVLQTCPIIEEHRETLAQVIGRGNLNIKGLIDSMLENETKWQAVYVFADLVIKFKEEAETKFQIEEKQKVARNLID